MFGSDASGTLKTTALWEFRLAETSLRELLYSSVFRLPISITAGSRLLQEIQRLISVCEQATIPNERLSFTETGLIHQLYSEFESVFKAELGQTGVFLVSDKNAMNTLTLIERGEEAFPPDLLFKVPMALPDVKDAMRCIALELPTAAAFHLHRATETVLKVYWSTLTSDVLPKKATMGQLAATLEQRGLGNPAVVSSLRDIVKLHRNPTIHPEQRLDDVEQAISLYGAIRSVIGFMLREISSPSPSP